MKNKDQKSKIIASVIPEEIDLLIGDKFGKYSKYIIQDRALPDLRDGLKPVQRRILFAMNELRLFSDSPYKKSARVVGDVIGKYHPHGDTSVYEAMVRLSQDWKVNMPLIDMHGNKGSIDGDSPAAMRYTEARLSKIAQYLLMNIDKSLIKFSPNFDDTEQEPVVLPAQFPNILVNGATGIASGYATNIPPHNINEVINALIYVLQNEDIKLSDLTKIIKGPDFPTGGIIQSKKAIKEAYQSGKGRIVLRSKMTYDQKEEEIIITEIPFETNKADIVRQIDELIRSGKLSGLKEVRDDSDRKGLQITILAKSDINVDAVFNYLYKHTDLQKNYSINMVMIKDKKPQLLGLIDIITSFATFLLENNYSLFNFELQKNNSRMEIVEGLITAVSIIDEVIKEIRKSKNKSDAKERLMSRFKLNERQAEAIVNLRLYRLTSTDIVELNEEKNDLLKLISHYKKGIDNKKYLIECTVKELEEINNKFIIKRKSKIEEEIESLEIDETALIREEKVALVVTYHGYIKITSIKSKESSTAEDLGIRDDDVVISNVVTSNLNNLAIFTSSGKYYLIPIYKLKEFRWKDIGEHLGTYFSIEPNDKIISIWIAKDFAVEGNFVSATKKGLIKQSEISDLQMIFAKRGSKYISLKEGDEVTSVFLTKDSSDISTITSKGLVSRYPLSQVPTIGLNTSGVKNVNLNDEDEIICAIPQSSSNPNAQLLVITQNGKTKRFKSNEIRLTSRAQKGVSIATQSKSNPYRIINMFDVDNMEELNILSSNNKHITLKPKGDIPLTDLDSGGLSTIIKDGINIGFTDMTNDISKNIKKEIINNQNPPSQTSEVKVVKKNKTSENQLKIKFDDILEDI